MTEKLSPFDFVKMIYEKTRIPTEEEIGDYNPYIINIALSNNLDSVFPANELNANWQLGKRMQFDFLYFILDRRKRYGKWHKKELDREERKIDMVKEYYGYSTARAREVIPILDQQNAWKQIEEELKKGGLKKA